MDASSPVAKQSCFWPTGQQPLQPRARSFLSLICGAELDCGDPPGVTLQKSSSCGDAPCQPRPFSLSPFGLLAHAGGPHGFLGDPPAPSPLPPLKGQSCPVISPAAPAGPQALSRVSFTSESLGPRTGTAPEWGQWGFQGWPVSCSDRCG